MSVGNFVVKGDLVLSDEPDAFGAGRHAGADTMGEVCEFIGKGFDPGWGVRSLQEVTVLLDVAGDRVGNRIGLMDVGK